MKAIPAALLEKENWSKAPDLARQFSDVAASELSVKQMSDWICIMEKAGGQSVNPTLLAALSYLAAVTLAEVVTTLIDPRLGLVLHGLNLLAMLIHAALSSERRRQRLLFSLTLAPLIRLVSLSLPLESFPFAYGYMIVGTPLLLAALMAARVVRVNRKMAGVAFGRHGLLQLPIGLSGLGLGYLEYLILKPEPLIPEFRWALVLVPALVLLIFTGFVEEYIFRGVLQYTACISLRGFGLVYVSALFTALHIGYQSLLDLVFVFAVALFFSLAAHKTGSLLGVTLSHGLTNIGLFLIFPFIITAPRPVIPLTAIDRPVIEQPVQATATAAATPGIVSGPELIVALPTHTTRPTRTTQPAQTPLPSATPTAGIPPAGTLSQTATLCAPPEGWVAYRVRRGDSLALFRRIFNLKKVKLLAANCSPALVEVSPGQVFYLPHLPPTSTPVRKPILAIPARPPRQLPLPGLPPLLP